MATDEQITQAIAALQAGEPEPEPAETAETQPEPVANGAGEDLPSAEEILAGATEPEGDTDAGETEEKPVEADSEAAEADSGEESAIDYDLQVPMPDGRDPMRLGDLKDAVTEYERRESAITRRETELIQEAETVRSLLAQVGEIPPQVKQVIQQRQAAHLEQQHEKMLDLIPEMKTPEGHARVKAAVSNVGKMHGFSEQEIALCSDARLVNLLNSHARLLNRLESAKGSTKAQRGKPPAGRKVATGKRLNTDKLVQAAKNSSRHDVKVAAATQLLMGDSQ